MPYQVSRSTFFFIVDRAVGFARGAVQATALIETDDSDLEPILCTYYDCIDYLHVGQACQGASWVRLVSSSDIGTSSYSIGCVHCLPDCRCHLGQLYTSLWFNIDQYIIDRDSTRLYSHRRGQSAHQRRTEELWGKFIWLLVALHWWSSVKNVLIFCSHTGSKCAIEDRCRSFLYSAHERRPEY